LAHHEISIMNIPHHPIETRTSKLTLVNSTIEKSISKRMLITIDFMHDDDHCTNSSHTRYREH